MEAGKLDRYIVLQQAMKTANAARETTRTWIPLSDKVAAGVELPSTRQVMSSQQPQSEIDAVFTIRFRNDLAPVEDRRVVYQGRNYRIRGVREIGRREGLRLDCTARAE